MMKCKRIKFGSNWYQLTINNNPNIIHVAYDINGEFHEDSLSISEFINNNIEQELRHHMDLPTKQLCIDCSLDMMGFCHSDHPQARQCAARKFNTLI